MSKVIIDLFNIYQNLKEIPIKNQNLYFKKNDGCNCKCIKFIKTNIRKK